MAKDKKNQGKGAANHAGRPTGSYSSYGTSGYGSTYGYGSSNGAYGRSPYGVQQPTPANGAVKNGAPVQGNTKTEKVDLPDKANMTRKQKKLAKKSRKFDETDLRCYPMTIRGWIGTFILLAIPIIGGICAICWFFGVGNKSRTSWIRSYVVISLLIALLFGILFGVGFSVLSKNAKEEGYDGFNGTLYYAACKVVDLLEEPLGGPEATEEIKAMLAEALGLTSGSEGDNGEGGAGDGGFESEDWEGDENQEQYA